ncbi:MAG: response regulator transcription factor [Leptolyngbyaceae cyanobacterium SM2_5_2]|nr:response regulator transcription factor [Leptolyngbyaceae cyanobacterium SM2_5_2]
MKRVLIISLSAITQAGLAALIAEASDQWEGVRTRLPLATWPAFPPADCALVSWPLAEDEVASLDVAAEVALPVVALLGQGVDISPVELWQAGLTGLLPEQASGREIVAALNAAVAGLIAIHPRFLSDLLVLDVALLPRLPSEQAVLTPREVEVLTLLADGLSNKAIAQQLHLSEHTIKYHISAIFAKLNVSTRTEAAIVGAKAGLILL